MEEDERKKKLRAGKEKLAAFRKKKTKRKRQSDVAEGFDDEAVSPVRSDSSLDSSAEYTSSSDVSYASCEDPDSDGMSGDEISGQADMREIIKTRTKLRQAEDRISELEESLMGKQLALDKVIQENTQLKSKSEVKKLEELEAAVLKRDDIIKHLTVQLQLGVPTESQQQYRMETENLAKQVQLLQSQLQKAGQLLQSQSDKQNMSSQALQDAKTQILNLQDVITEKNTVLNQVSQNLNKFTEEYSALKNMYETVKQRESETNQVVQQLMVDAEVMRKQDKQNESVGKSSDDTDDTEKKLQALRSELEEMYGLQIAEMKQEVIQQFNLEKESLIKERDMLLAEMAKVKDDYQNAVIQSEEYIREKDNLSDELDKMSEDYEKETNRVREIQHKLAEFEAIVNNTSELQQECKLLRVQNDELKNKINSQQDSVVELKAELEILSNENIRFKDQMACLTQELDKQCNENSVAVHEKAKLSEQLNSLDNELLVARQENKSHMDKIESMKDVIHSLRGELERSEKEKEELTQKCEDISKSVHVERQKRDQEIERLKHQLENKSDRTVNSDISTDSQVWEHSDTLTDSKIDSCHRNSVDLLTSQEQQVLDIIDKVLDVDENVCETDSVSAYRDPHVLTTENIFIETDNVEPEIDIPVCENNQMISETDNKLSESDNKICNTDTLNSETDYKLSGSPQVEEQMDKVVCLTLDTEKTSQQESSMKTDIVEPLAEVSEIHFQSHTIHSDSFDDKDSGVISESMTFDLDGESLKVRESELQPIGTEHFQSRLEQVTNENEAFKSDIKKLNEQIEVMNTELELLKEDRQKLQVELDIVKHEKSTSTHEHSEESKYDSETTAVNKDGHQNVYGEKMVSLETEFNQSIDEKLENLLEENEELRKNLTDVSIELEKVKCEDYSELERSELEDKVHQMELKINSYVAGEASLLQENEQLKELNSELQLQVDELQVREKDLKLLKVEMDETVEVKERDFQKMVEEQMVEHEEFDFEKEELLKTNREMRKELDQLSVCEQNTRDECELLEEKCKILDTEIKEYETKTSDLETRNQTLTLKVGDLEELLNSVRLDEESRSVGEQKAKDECEMLSEKCKILDTDIREYESKTANLEAQNQALTLKIEDLEKLLNTVKLDEQSPASSDEVKVQDSSNEDLLNSKEDLLNKIEDLEAKMEILSIEKADLQEKEVALAMVMEEKNKSDEKMLEFQERTREKIEELTNTINEKEERLRQTENRYDTEIQILKTENQKLVKSLEDDLKNATEREEMLQTNAEKFRFEMEALIDKNEYLSKLVDELQTPGVTSTNDDVEIQLEEKVVAETISECENVYGTTASPSVVTSDTPSDSYKPEMAEVQKKSARKSLMKQFSKDSLEDRESSVEKEVPGVDSCDQVEEVSENVVNMVDEETPLKLENLRKQYEEQLETLRQELASERHKRQEGDMDTALQSHYQQVSKELQEHLELEDKARLEKFIKDIYDQHKLDLDMMQQKQQEDTELQIKAMKLTLEQVYTSQLELVKSDLEKQHQEALSRLEETLSKAHKDEINRLECEWSARVEELQEEHADELNDSLLENSVEDANATYLHKLSKKLSDEHKALLKKISDDLEKSPHRMSPFKRRDNKGAQTDSEDYDTETDSIKSMPVTGIEYQQLEDREKVMTTAEDVRKTLDGQREEIVQLRSRMLAEYEQLLTIRTEVMSSQTQEVEKLQREMEDLNDKYQTQMKDFQDKVEVQTEEAMKSRLSDHHSKELDELRSFYEKKVSDMEESFREEIELVKNKYEKQLANLQTAGQQAKSQSRDAGSEVTPSGREISDDFDAEREYVKHTTTLTSISDDESESTTTSMRTVDLAVAVKELEAKFQEKEADLSELKDRLTSETMKAKIYKDQLDETEQMLTDVEEELKLKVEDLDKVNQLLQEKDEVIENLENDKETLEEKCAKDMKESEKEHSKIVDELNERLAKMKKELEASQEQERMLEEQYDELQHQHKETLDALKQDLEHENKMEVESLQSEFKVQMDIELKRLASDLTAKYEDEIRKLQEGMGTTGEMFGEENVEQEEMYMLETVEEEKSDYDDSQASKSGDSQSDKKTVISVDGKKQEVVDNMERSDKEDSMKDDFEKDRDDTIDDDDESEVSESETRLESEMTTDTLESAIDSVSQENIGDTKEGLTDSTSSATVEMLLREITKAKEQTMLQLREEYETKLQSLEQTIAEHDNNVTKLKQDIEKENESKINDLRTSYENRIKELETALDDDSKLEEVKTEYESRIKMLEAELEQSKSEISSDARDKLKHELSKNYDESVSQLRKEYEEKMELLKQELQEMFDAEKEEIEKEHRKELEEAEEKYDVLIEGIRSGDAPEVADLVRDRYDTELEMAKTLMQQEFDETLESEQQRFLDQHQEMMDKFVSERQEEAEELKKQHDTDLSELRQKITEQYENRIRELESIQKEKLQTSEKDDDTKEKETTEGDVSGDDEVLDKMRKTHEEKMKELQSKYEHEITDLKNEFEKKHTEELSAASTDADIDKEDLDEAHQQELQDLEDKLTNKHQRELNNLEDKLKSAMIDMEEKYKSDVEALQNKLEEQQVLMKEAGIVAPVVPRLQLGSLILGSTIGSDYSTDGTSEYDPSSVRTPAGGIMEKYMSIDRVEVVEEGKEPEKISPRDSTSSRSQESAESKEDVAEQSTEPLINFDESMQAADTSKSSVRDKGGLPDEVGEDLLVPMTAPEREASISPFKMVEDRTKDKYEIEDIEEEIDEEIDSYEDSDRSATPPDMLQTRSLGDTLSFQPLRDEAEEDPSKTKESKKDNKIKELEAEVKRLTEKLHSQIEEEKMILTRRERETDEGQNLVDLLRSDLDRVNVERESVARTNDKLLQLLSDSVKTFMAVEESIGKKFKKMVSDGIGEQPTTSSRGNTPPLPVQEGARSPRGAEGGDELPQNTSILSNVTDEGLDLSERISESIFQGPELDHEGEEILSDASNRLQSSVTRLLEMIEETTQQLLDAKNSQQELLAQLTAQQQECEQLAVKCQDLEERISDEVEAKEYLALELHKAEGLIEGYTSERDSLDQSIQELEEKKEALVLELETTKNRLQDLEHSHHEAISLREQIQRQQDLMQDNVGDEAQVTTDTAEVAPPAKEALLLEVTRLNHDKRQLEDQLRQMQDKYEGRVHELEGAGEETERHYVALLESRKRELDDLRLHLESVEKKLEANKQFVEEQTIEREQEREEYQREVDRWKKVIQDKEKKEQQENRLQREVEDLTEQLQDHLDTQSAFEQRTEKLQLDLQVNKLTADELKALVHQLEQELEDKHESENQLKQKVENLETEVRRQQAINDELTSSLKSPPPESDRYIEEDEEETEETGTTGTGTRRRRRLPIPMSLQQEENLIHEKEELQNQVEEQLKQISALKNQLDEMRHRGSEFSEDTQVGSLQKSLQRQKDLLEDKDTEMEEIKESLEDLNKDISNKDKYIQQLSAQIQTLTSQKDGGQTEREELNKVQEENENLKVKIKSLEGRVDTTPIDVLSQNLIEEKNQEIDHLNGQLDQLQREIDDFKSGQAVTDLQEEVDRLQGELDKRNNDIQYLRASYTSDGSITDTEIPAVSTSFTENTNLQQELEDSVAHRLEEVTELQQEIHVMKDTLQTKEDEIIILKKELNKKDSALKSGSVDSTVIEDVVQEKEMMIEQLNQQIEGLTLEVESLSDFQYKLQEDFDTVQTMLEEKEKEIDNLTKELTEKPVSDTMDSTEMVSKLEVEITTLRKEVSERDNVIDEKAEELYVLNEKVEQQEAQLEELADLQKNLVEKELEIQHLKESAPSVDELQDELAEKEAEIKEKESQLEDKNEEMQKMKVELDTVQEHLMIAENLQKKLEQAGLLGPDVLVKEKEEEIALLREELSGLKERMEAERDQQLMQYKDDIDNLNEELQAVKRQKEEREEEERDELREKLEAEYREEMKKLTSEIGELHDKVYVSVTREEFEEKEAENKVLQQEVIELQQKLDSSEVHVELKQKEEELVILKEQITNMKNVMESEGLDVQWTSSLQESKIKELSAPVVESMEQVRQESMLLQSEAPRASKTFSPPPTLQEVDEEIQARDAGLAFAPQMSIEEEREETANQIKTQEMIIDKLKDELSMIYDQVQEKDDELAKIKVELSDLQEHLVPIEQKDEEIEKLTEEVESLRQEMEPGKQKSEEIEKIRIELKEQFDDEIKEKEDVITELKEEVSNIENELTSRLKGKNEKIYLLETELENIKSSDGSSKDEILAEKNQEVSRLQEELSLVKEQLESSDGGETKLSQVLAEKEEQLSQSQDETKQLQEEVEWLQQQVDSIRQMRITDSQEINEQKDHIESLQNEVETLTSKLEDIEKSDDVASLRSQLLEQEEHVKELEKECAELRKKVGMELQLEAERLRETGSDAGDVWAELQQTQSHLEDTARELSDTTSKLGEAEDKMDYVNKEMEETENKYKSLQNEFWEASSQLSETVEKLQNTEDKLQQTAIMLNEREEQLQKLQSELQTHQQDTDVKSKSVVDAENQIQQNRQEMMRMIQNKEEELFDIKQRLTEAVELSEQQLQVVERKDQEYVQLKLEIQQLISDKDRTIKELKQQLQRLAVEKESEMAREKQEADMALTDKDKIIGDLQQQVLQLRALEEASSSGAGDADNKVVSLETKLLERENSLRELQEKVQTYREGFDEKVIEISEVKAALEQAQGVAREAETKVAQDRQVAYKEIKALQQELQRTKEELQQSREVPYRRLQEQASVESIEDLEPTQREFARLQQSLSSAVSELELYRSTASLGAKDYVRKVMELREELSVQHQRHIKDIQDRVRQEANTNLAQLRIKYEDEIEHLKKLHQKELQQKMGENKREMDKQHKKEINQLLQRHQEEIQLIRLQEPQIVSQSASGVEMGQRLRAEVAATERLDSRLLQRLSQRSEGVGQDNGDASTEVSSIGDLSFDESVSSRLQGLMSRLHKEGVQMLSLSELQFLNNQMNGAKVDREADMESLQAAWDNEKQSLLSAIQSLKDLLSQTNKLRGVERGPDVSDWRSELLNAIGYVFAKEREALLAQLRSHVLSHPNTNLNEIQRLEHKIRNQEAHQQSAMDQIFRADRQSLLAEIRDLRAHANITQLQHQEEKERLTEQLSKFEDQTSKRERQLKRQVQLLEYKMQQEKILQDDLRTSLEIEQERTSELSTQISQEKNNNVDLQSDISSMQLQISKLKDGLEREQSRFVSVTHMWDALVNALEEEKGKNQKLTELLDTERNRFSKAKSELEDTKSRSQSGQESAQHAIERLEADLAAERDRRLQAENAQEMDKLTMSNLQQELDKEKRTLHALESEMESKLQQLQSALEFEKLKNNDYNSALERERTVTEKLQQSLADERSTLRESADREKSLIEDLQLQLESERSKVHDLQVALKREANRISDLGVDLETERDNARDELEQEQLATRQMKHEMDQLQLQKLDMTRQYEHERELVLRLKAEREQNRKEIKTLNDVLNERNKQRDSEKFTDRRKQKQIERERDDSKMKLHENELEMQRLTQKILDLEEQVTLCREKEMDAIRELEHEKLRSLTQPLHERVSPQYAPPPSVSFSSRELPSAEQKERWRVYKAQIESLCQSLQYIILQYQDIIGRSPSGNSDTKLLNTALKNLLSEVKQVQTPLEFESGMETNLVGRPSSYVINERVLKHNNELTNFVSKLTEEKMEQRRNIAQLEEELWRYRQNNGHLQNGDDPSYSDSDRQLEQRANWAKERLSLQLQLNKAEQEVEQLQADLRIERERRSALGAVTNGATSDTDKDKIQRLYGKYLRAESFRKALIYQKKYLLLLLGGFQDCEETTLALIARMGAYPSPEDVQRRSRHRKPFTTFRSAVRVTIAIIRMKYLVKKWQRATRVGSPVVMGSIDHHQGYIPNSGSFSPPRLSYSQHVAPSNHQYTRQSRGGNRSASVPAYEPEPESYPVPSRAPRVHSTPPTRDYSSSPYNQRNADTSGARRKLLTTSLSQSSSTSSRPHRDSPLRQRAVSEDYPLHDDYIQRLENLQTKLGSMDHHDSPRMRTYPRR